MNDALKQTLKRVLPEPFLKVARYFKPQKRFDRRFSVDTFGVLDPEQLDVKDSRRQRLRTDRIAYFPKL
jgi:hypothetical protein